MGMSAENIFVSDVGKVIEIDSEGARFSGTVQAGKVLIDGSGVGDVGNIVLRDRKNLSESGLIIAVATVSLEEGILMSGPEIVSRGFVYVRESEELINGARDIATRVLVDALDEGIKEWSKLKELMKNAISKYVFAKTKKKPVILPILLNL